MIAPAVPAAAVPRDRDPRGPAEWLAARPLPLLGALGVAFALLAVAGYVVDDGGARGPVGTTAVLAACHLPLGIFVLRRLPGHALGRLMLLTGALATVATLATAWSGWLPAAWLSQWAWWPPLAVLPVLLLLVPDGRLPSRRWRPLAALLVTAGVVATLTFAVAAVSSPRTLLSEETGRAGPDVWLLIAVALGAVAVVLLGCLGVLAALVVRWRAAGPLGRRQLACLLPAVAVLAVGLAVDAVAQSTVAWSAAVAALPVGLAVAVLRYRLHDLDLYVHRGLVWLVLSVLVVAVYAGAVAALGAVVRAPGVGGLPLPALLAAGLVAAALQPGQRLVQRGVTRLLYGRRDEPHAVLAGLRRHLESMPDPLTVLPAIAATIADELRVPYVAVRVRGDDGTVRTAAEHGRRVGDPHRFGMRAGGRDVGELLVAPRRPGETFNGAETALLDDLAGQSALAADAVRSSVALAGARDRLVLAREEERRRLRRDLHDGVASTLAGSRMLTRALRGVVPGDGAAPPLVDALGADLEAAAAEVRALIDDLRPAALDDGLTAALEALGARAAVPVTVTVTGRLDDLPAAVEVAAYRIAAEAVTNVVKHAPASSCALTADRSERDLLLRIDDDGAGIRGPSPEGSGTGVGLGSITERAAELGGRAVVGPRDGGGTRVEVLLPLPDR